jgi:tRNA-Thr(GGU) m(6)t(6)A37 methyltransferase TsaA
VTGAADEWSVRAIGRVSSTRDEVIDDDWDSVSATITLDERFGVEALAGLSDFSHIEVVFLFDRVDPDTVTTGSRHPRGNPDWPEVGVFAQRVKNRPNRIGLSTCELLGVEGRVIRVRGLDAIEGTPVLDIKPYLVEFGARGEVRQPAWAHELMAGYF